MASCGYCVVQLLRHVFGRNGSLQVMRQESNLCSVRNVLSTCLHDKLCISVHFCAAHLRV